MINSKQDIKLTSPYSISYYKNIEQIKEEWDQLSNDNVFLHSSFLSALEQAPPSRTSFRYCIVKKNSTPISILYFQVKMINLYLSLRMDTIEPESLHKRVWHRIKSFLAQRLKANVLVSGNMTLTGLNAFSGVEPIEKNIFDQLLYQSMEEVIKCLKKEKIKIRAILAKDYYEEECPALEQYGFAKFQVQPNMIVELPVEWKTYNDYTAALRKKYRTREKRARKKASAITKKVLDLSDLHSLRSEMISQYKNVVENAGFNLFILPDDYFYTLKKHLGEKIKITGYFEEEKLIGFYTAILNHGELDAHFLGYDKTLNRDRQLYLNMLYDLIKDAIESNVSRLIMSRTALEIKSSVGAKPREMTLFFKVINPILNLGAQRGLAFFSPKTLWEPRNPF